MFNYNPFPASKGRLFSALTDDAVAPGLKANMLHQLLSKVSDEDARKIESELSMHTAAAAFGTLLAEIFAPKPNRSR